MKKILLVALLLICAVLTLPAMGVVEEPKETDSTTVESAQPLVPGSKGRLKLATTTSTENSGLLGFMLPVFEGKTGYKVDEIGRAHV